MTSLPKLFAKVNIDEDIESPKESSMINPSEVSQSVQPEAESIPKISRIVPIFQPRPMRSVPTFTATEISQPTTEISQPTTEISQPTTEISQPTTEISQPTTEISQPQPMRSVPTFTATKISQPTATEISQLKKSKPKYILKSKPEELKSDKSEISQSVQSRPMYVPKFQSTTIPEVSEQTTSIPKNISVKVGRSRRGNIVNYGTEKIVKIVPKEEKYSKSTQKSLNTGEKYDRFSKRFFKVKQYIEEGKLKIPSISDAQYGEPTMDVSEKIFSNITKFIHEKSKYGDSNIDRIHTTMREIEFDNLDEYHTAIGREFIPVIGTNIYMVYSFIPKERVNKRFVDIMDSTKIFKKYLGFTSSFVGLDDVFYKTKYRNVVSRVIISVQDYWESKENCANIVINYYNNINNDVVKNSFKKFGGILNKYLAEPIRDNMYRDIINLPPNFSINHYDIIFVISIIYKYSSVTGKNISDIDVLDLASGWLDRMSGVAIAGCKSYKGYDPNVDLKDVYKSIRAFFKSPDDAKSKKLKSVVPKSNTSMDIEFIKFDDAELPIMPNQMMANYDIVFISPPYYDKEIYSNMILKMSFSEWFYKWLIPMIDKALSVLTVDEGWGIISVDNTKNIYSMVVSWFRDELEYHGEYIKCNRRYIIYSTIIRTRRFNMFDPNCQSNIVIKRV